MLKIVAFDQWSLATNYRFTILVLFFFVLWKKSPRFDSDFYFEFKYENGSKLQMNFSFKSGFLHFKISSSFFFWRLLGLYRKARARVLKILRGMIKNV